MSMLSVLSDLFEQDKTIVSIDVRLDNGSVIQVNKPTAPVEKEPKNPTREEKIKTIQEWQARVGNYDSVYFTKPHSIKDWIVSSDYQYALTILNEGGTE